MTRPRFVRFKRDEGLSAVTLPDVIGRYAIDYRRPDSGPLANRKSEGKTNAKGAPLLKGPSRSPTVWVKATSAEVSTASGSCRAASTGPDNVATISCRTLSGSQTETRRSALGKGDG
jgi:hypothetical protein